MRSGSTALGGSCTAVSVFISVLLRHRLPIQLSRRRPSVTSIRNPRAQVSNLQLENIGISREFPSSDGESGGNYFTLAGKNSRSRQRRRHSCNAVLNFSAPDEIWERCRRGDHSTGNIRENGVQRGQGNGRRATRRRE